MSFTASAQDLLINSGGDSLNVKIIEVDEKVIHYSMPYAEDVFQYPVKNAKFYSRGFFVDGLSNVSAKRPENSDRSPSPYSTNTTLRVHLHSGWSTLLGQTSEDTPDQLQDHATSLNSGLNYSAGLDIFFHKHIGLGGQITGFHSSARMDDYIYFDPEEEETFTGVATDSYDFRSLDLKLIGRVSFHDDRFTIFAYIAGSHLWFTSNSERPGITFALKSNTFGGGAGLGLDFKITESFAIGMQAHALTAQLNEYEIQTSLGARLASFDGFYDDVSRFDISFGLRWYW